MAERKRRDKGDGCVSQRKDGTWTSRLRIGATPEGEEEYGITWKNIVNALG